MYQQNYENKDRYGFPQMPSQQSLASTVSATMKKVYVKMTLGLVVSALTALLCAHSVAFYQMMATSSWFMWVLIIAELGLVFAISGAINRMSATTATMLFYLFAIVNGAMLSSIFIVYSIDVIYKTFFITAATFGAMSVYGYTTSRDLSRWGSFLIMALFGLIIASVVNIFLHSNTLDWIVSIFGVFIFTGLTAWDTQQIKAMAQTIPADDQENTGKLATLGALSLYLDFINLFLYLLRIFGNRD